MEPGVLSLRVKTDAAGLTAEVAAIYRVAFRLTGNRHDAEDLVQDVCERALSRAPEFAAAEDCRRWLLRVLFNRFVDGTRHQRRSPVLAAGTDVHEQALSPAGLDPAELAQQSDGEAALAVAWERLEPAQQMLLLLRAEGYDLGEISRITGIDRPALSSRLHRARASLAKYLNDLPSAQPLRVIPETEK